MRGSYNTNQKDRILNVIKNSNHSFTIKDICLQLDDVGQTTIYRFIDKLARDGVLKKEIGIDNITYYQYLEECDCDDHFYLKCTSCGELIHIDCECIEELANHIKKEHDFKLSKKNIIINGLCSKCSKKKENLC